MPNPSSKYFFCTTPGCKLEGHEFDAATAENIHYRCIACKGPLISAEVDAPPGLLPSELPTYLALPWQEYLTKKHPRIKLHWLINTNVAENQAWQKDLFGNRIWKAIEGKRRKTGDVECREQFGIKA